MRRRAHVGTPERREAEMRLHRDRIAPPLYPSTPPPPAPGAADRALRLAALPDEGRRGRAAAAGVLRRLDGPRLRPTAGAERPERAGVRDPRVDAARRVRRAPRQRPPRPAAGREPRAGPD